MPITVNVGGVLHELSTVTSNVNGVLHELSTIHSNNGGVLHEIYSATSFPSGLTWQYANTSNFTPKVSNNGYTVQNTNSNIGCQNVKSSIFEIKGTVQISVTISLTGTLSNGSSGVTVATSSGTTVGVIDNHTSGTRTKTFTLTSGTYVISGGGGYGSASGSGSALYTISIAFSK